MKMSPPWDGLVFEAGFAVVERDASVESLVDVHFGTSEAEATCLLGNLEAAALPLHDVVVADGAFVQEAADAFETFRSGAPGGSVFARRPGKAAGVGCAGDAQHRGWRSEGGGLG